MPGGSCSHFAPQRQPRSWRSAVKSFRKSCICRLYREHPWDRRTGCRNLFQSTVSICSERTAFQRKEQTAPKDPFNAVLSLTYTLLTCDAALAANTAGLDSYVGFLHALEYGRHSLACDLIEPVRPQADQFALQLFSEGILTKDNFATSNQGCLLDKAGRSAFYPAYEKAAPAWRSVLRKSALGLAERLVADFRNSQFRMPAYGQGK